MQIGGSLTLMLESQPLPSALRLLGRQAGIDIGFDPALLEGRTAPAVQGTFSVEEAVDRLLAGTGLRARALRGGTLLIEASPGVSVSSLTEVLVTGSRIRQSDSETATPLITQTGRDLQRSAPGTLMDGLSVLPQFTNNHTPVGFSDGASGPSGASNLNLRGLGAERTLVLLNGRRMVPTSRNGYVDIALMPEALVHHVDIVTGGASAAYGSDAVGGVANIVLDTQFSGLRLQLQRGVTSRDDYRSGKSSLVLGSRAGERWHVVASLEHFSADGIVGYHDRDWFRSWGPIPNPEPGGPREIMVSGLRSRAYTYGGLITSGPLAGTQFLEGSQPAAFTPGDIVSTYQQRGGDGVDQGAHLWIVPDQRRTNLFSHATLNLSTQWQLFLQALHADSVVEFDGHPQAFYTTAQATIRSDNAFLPAAIGALMREQQVNTFTLGRMSRDIGAPRITNDSGMTAVTVGAEGRVGGYSVSAHYQFGRSGVDRRYSGVVRLDRLYRALDSVRHPVTGLPACRSTLLLPDDGCVPLNVFGEGSPSAAAEHYLKTTFNADQTVQQHLLDITVAGEWRGWPTGTLAFASGMTYREESFNVTVLPRELAALRVEDPALYGYSGVPSRDLGGGIFERSNYWNDARGAYEVAETFVEAHVPLIGRHGRPALNAEVAGRYADYAGSGGVWSWKVALDWHPTDTLRLRATRSRDMRAANLAERFDTTGAAARLDHDPFNPDGGSYGIVLIRGGNEAVRPENSDAMTYGLVYEPLWGQGLRISMDYFDIRIRDAIVQLGVQNTLDQCYVGHAIACDLIRRDPDSGQVVEIRDVYVNAALARTRGVDALLQYRSPVSLFGGTESIDIRGNASRILELSTNILGSPFVDRVGQTGRGVAAPDWRFTLNATYRNGPFDLFVEQRYISGGVRDATLREGVDIDDNSVDSVSYTTLGWSFRQPAVGGTLEWFGVVNNLFDSDPPRAATATPFGTTHTNEELFDPLGRRYTLGFRWVYR